MRCFLKKKIDPLNKFFEINKPFTVVVGGVWGLKGLAQRNMEIRGSGVGSKVWDWLMGRNL